MTILAIITPYVDSIITIAGLAFFASLQVGIFKRVRGVNYASFMMTGNITNTSLTVARAIDESDPKVLKQASYTIIIIFTFMVGVAASTWFAQYLHEYSLYTTLLPLFILNYFSIYRSKRKKHRDRTEHARPKPLNQLQQSPPNSGKLEVSDLITIGVFAALYFVMVCIATLVSTLFTGGFGSIFLPAITALISGCVYMLLAARLGKFGGITVMGVIIGLFLFISGHFVLSFIASIVFPVAADLIARAGKYKSKALLLVSYVVFSYA